MRVTFYAHACFRLEGNGVSIITDPYEPADARFDPVGETCDIVLMSSAVDNFHSYAAQVPGRPLVINALEIGPDGLSTRGVHIQSFPNREDKDTGSDDNAMYAVTLDGVRLLHMGDAGQAPTAEQVEALAGQVDVLFALTGGKPTISLDNLQRFIEAIRPHVVIPMHYYSERGRLNILPVTAFTERYPADIVHWHDSPSIDFHPDGLPSTMQIFVLPQSR